jgi:hypothetical protein
MDFILDPNLVLYLPLWKLDGSSFMSKDACGHLCTVTGALWTPKGRYFDGTDDYILIPHHATFNLTTNATFMFWINPTVFGSQDRLIHKNTAWIVMMADIGNKLRLYDATDGDLVDSDTVFTVDTWQMAAVTKAGTAVLWYRNGVAAGGGTLTSATFAISAIPVNIGIDEDHVTKAFDGLIGGVWIYNRSLTPLEIQNIYLTTRWRYR